MLKTIATLVRYGQDYTCISRSFEKIDDDALAVIRRCIEEDNDGTFSEDENEEHFLPAFAKLKKDFSWLGEPKTDFHREGTPIWEYYDGIEVFGYAIHVSLMETPEKTSKDYLNDIKDAEKKVKELTKKQVRDLFARIAPSAKTIDLSDEEVQETYENALYGMGVSLYDKHGYVETGILRELSIEPTVKGIFNGCESDCDESLGFDELESWSQVAIVDLLEDILKDITSGEVFVEVEDGTAYVKCKEEN